MPYTGRLGNGGTRQGSATFADGRGSGITILGGGGTFTPSRAYRIVGLSRLGLTITPQLGLVSVTVSVRASLELVVIAAYTVAAGVVDTQSWNVCGREATFSVRNANIGVVTLNYLFSGAGAA